MGQRWVCRNHRPLPLYKPTPRCTSSFHPSRSPSPPIWRWPLQQWAGEMISTSDQPRGTELKPVSYILRGTSATQLFSLPLQSTEKKPSFPKKKQRKSPRTRPHAPRRLKIEGLPSTPILSQPPPPHLRHCTAMVLEGVAQQGLERWYRWLGATMTASLPWLLLWVAVELPFFTVPFPWSLTPSHCSTAALDSVPSCIPAGFREAPSWSTSGHRVFLVVST